MVTSEAIAQGNSAYLNRTSPFLPFNAPEPSDYNLKLGKLTARLRAGTQVELNDNIFITEKEAESDIAFGPYVGAGFLWPLSQENILHFDIGLGYRWYLDHRDLDSFSITPNSHIDYRMLVGDLQINIHDDFGLQIDPSTRPDLSGAPGQELNYKRFSNTAGINVGWQATRRLNLGVGYDYTIDRSLTEDYTYLDHDTHTFSGSAFYTLSPRWTVGLNTSYSINDYLLEESSLNTVSIHNDGDTFQIGPVLVYKPSEFLTFTATGGYVTSHFDGKPQSAATNVVEDSNINYSGAFYGGSIRHTINKKISHSFQVNQNVGLGINANYTETLAMQYGVNTKLNSAISLNTTLGYEKFKSSNEYLASVAGKTSYGDSGYRLMAYIGTSLQISRKWTLGIAYTHAFKDSDFVGRDYTQNRVIFDLARQF